MGTLTGLGSSPLLTASHFFLPFCNQLWLPPAGQKKEAGFWCHLRVWTEEELNGGRRRSLSHHTLPVPQGHMTPCQPITGQTCQEQGTAHTDTHTINPVNTANMHALASFLKVTRPRPLFTQSMMSSQTHRPSQPGYKTEVRLPDRSFQTHR